MALNIQHEPEFTSAELIKFSGGNTITFPETQEDVIDINRAELVELDSPIAIVPSVS